MKDMSLVDGYEWCTYTFKLITQMPCVRLPPSVECLQLSQLGQTDRGMDIRHAEIESQLVVIVPLPHPMLADEAARRGAARPPAGNRIQIKSDPGGLKDIHLTLDLLRAKMGLAEAIPRRLFPKLVALDPGHQEEYFTLLRTLNFLLRLRVLYQLTVGHESTIDPAHMQHALSALRIRAAGPSLAAALLERYRVRTGRAAQATARLIDWIRAELEGPAAAADVTPAPPSAILRVDPHPVRE